MDIIKNKRRIGQIWKIEDVKALTHLDKIKEKKDKTTKNNFSRKHIRR